MEIKKIVAEEEKKPATFLNLVNIALDTYDDIFSDFDPSPYSTRLLSDDFLKELQKKYTERQRGEFEVRFTVPAAQRNPKTEALIKKRIKNYFEQILKNTEYEMQKKKKKGIVYILVGFLLLAGQMYLSTFYDGGNYFVRLIEIILVPAGWYGMFEGIANFLETPASLENQYKFYTKLKNANYIFLSEEDVVKIITETSQKTQEEKPKQAGSEKQIGSEKQAGSEKQVSEKEASSEKPAI